MHIALASLASRKVVPLGMLYVASALREHGHTVLWIEARDRRELVACLRKHKVDLVGFSATTGMHTLYMDWAAQARSALGVKTFFGGPHPTFVPSLINHPAVDAIALGEADHTVVELVRALEGNCSGEPVAGVLFKKEGRLVQGATRAPPEDLDALPSPAFDLVYSHHRERARFRVKSFLASRGCAYRCTYCASAGYHALYGPKVKAVRLRSPAAVVSEIEQVKRRWGVELVWLADASLWTCASWAKELIGRIHRDIRKPFFCKLRPDHVTAESAALLARRGCAAAGLGLESGDDRIRKEVLGRAIEREQILAACRHLRAAGIRIVTFSMLGIPSETFEDALKTVDLNVECQPDYAEAMLLQPYPGTPLANAAVRKGWYDGDYDRLGYSYLAVSPFHYSDIRMRDKMERLQKLLGLAVEFPEVRKHLPLLTKLKAPRLQEALFTVWYELGFGRRIHGVQP